MTDFRFSILFAASHKNLQPTLLFCERAHVFHRGKPRDAAFVDRLAYLKKPAVHVAAREDSARRRRHLLVDLYRVPVKRKPQLLREISAARRAERDKNAVGRNRAAVSKNDRADARPARYLGNLSSVNGDFSCERGPSTIDKRGNLRRVLPVRQNDDRRRDGRKMRRLLERIKLVPDDDDALSPVEETGVVVTSPIVTVPNASSPV